MLSKIEQRESFRFLLFFTQTGRQPKLPILCLGFWLSSRLGKKEEKSKKLMLYILVISSYQGVFIEELKSNSSNNVEPYPKNIFKVHS
jgi:hypothetical protein